MIRVCSSPSSHCPPLPSYHPFIELTPNRRHFMLFLLSLLNPAIIIPQPVPAPPPPARSGVSPVGRWPLSCSKQSQIHGDVWKSEMVIFQQWPGCQAGVDVSPSLLTRTPRLTVFIHVPKHSGKCVWKRKEEGVIARPWLVCVCLWD